MINYIYNKDLHAKAKKYIEEEIADTLLKYPEFNEEERRIADEDGETLTYILFALDALQGVQNFIEYAKADAAAKKGEKK